MARYRVRWVVGKFSDLITASSMSKAIRKFTVEHRKKLMYSDCPPEPFRKRVILRVFKLAGSREMLIGKVYDCRYKAGWKCKLYKKGV